MERFNLFLIKNNKWMKNSGLFWPAICWVWLGLLIDSLTVTSNVRLESQKQVYPQWHLCLCTIHFLQSFTEVRTDVHKCARLKENPHRTSSRPRLQHFNDGDNLFDSSVGSSNLTWTRTSPSLQGSNVKDFLSHSESVSQEWSTSGGVEALLWSLHRCFYGAEHWTPLMGLCCSSEFNFLLSFKSSGLKVRPNSLSSLHCSILKIGVF